MTDITAGLIERIRSALAAREPRRVTEAGLQRAAVALVVSGGPEPFVLIVRRQERDGDPWSGHVALPGGFQASEDTSATATAVRETLEETGLDLGRVGEVLGHLDDVYPRSVLLPPVAVTPVVFAVPGPTPVTPSHEVAEAAWVPVQALFDPARREPYEVPLPSGPRRFDSIRVGGFTIWGLTERVLTQLSLLLA